MREQYLHKLLIYLGQRFTTTTFILLACIHLPEILGCILKFLFVLEYNSGKKFVLTIFWQTITQTIFRYMYVMMILQTERESQNQVILDIFTKIII